MVYRLITVVFIISLLFSCRGKKMLFEDNFETHTVGELPDAPWEKEGVGQVFVDTTRSYSGHKAVHLISGEGYRNRAFIGIKHIFPVVGNQYYGSLWLYVKEASPDGVHWTMIQSSGQVPGKNYQAQIRYGGQHHQQLMANYETIGVASDCWQHAPVKIPESEWCFLQWFFDGTTNTMKFWLNEAEITEITVIDKGEGCVNNGTDGKWEFPVFENLFVGWVDYQTGGGTRELWIDDVSVWQR